jgi:hypothetical protein
MSSTMMSERPASSTIVTVTAVYILILALFAVCVGGVFGLVGGGLGAIASNPEFQEAMEETIEQAREQQEAQLGRELTDEEEQALNLISQGGGAAFTGIALITGIISLLVGIGLLVDAIGLFQKRSWTYVLTLVLLALHSIVLILGFNILGAIFLVINVIVIILFLTNADVKQALGRA